MSKNQTISWEELGKNGLLLLDSSEAVCFEELLTLERDQVRIEGYLRNSPSPDIYAACPEVCGFTFYGCLEAYEVSSQVRIWPFYAHAAINKALREGGIEPTAVERIINKALASVPVYKPCAKVDFTGYLESLEGGNDAV